MVKHPDISACFGECFNLLRKDLHMLYRRQRMSISAWDSRKHSLRDIGIRSDWDSIQDFKLNYLSIYFFFPHYQCGIYLTLAQTWAVSQHTSFVSHEKVIQKSCSSFETRCIGKVCMSRAALPYHVHDLGMWPFLKACRERHLERSRSFVGKALLSQGSCFCEDVTKLSEEEYPLVHNARMNGLTSCFAIFLHSVEANDEYVLEFFLPPDIKDSEHVQNIVQTMKQNIERASGFILGNSSFIKVVGPPLTQIGNHIHQSDGSWTDSYELMKAPGCRNWHKSLFLFDRDR